MNFTQQIEADKLTPAFLEYVKALFKGKKIRLTIEDEPDDTTYLMSSEANHQRLMKSIRNIKKRQKLVAVDKQKLRKTSL
jgi:hypothetical protein